MTASRRQFTFGALMLALAGEAVAAGPGQKQVQQQKSGEPAKIRPRFTMRREGAELKLDLSLVNEGPAADVIVAWGSRHGPHIQAFVDIEGERTELAQVRDMDRREIMSRMGPRPRYAPMAKAAELEIGTYRFAWIDGMPDVPVTVSGYIETTEGQVMLDEEVLAWKRTET